MATSIRTLTEKTTAQVGAAPHGHIAYESGSDQVWVLNSGEESISLLDGATGKPAGAIDVGGTSVHVILDAKGGLGYVALADGALAIVDAGERRVSKRIELPAGSRPGALLPMLGRQRIYVLATGTPQLFIVDTGRQELVGTLPTGRGSAWGQPHENPCGKIHIANADSDDVTVIDDTTEQVVATVPAGRRPHRNAIFRERGLMYTANIGAGTLTAISVDSDRVEATIEVGEAPFRLVGAEKKTGRDELWVLNRGSDAKPSGYIAIVSGTDHRVVNTIQVADRPCNWLFDGPLAHVVSMSGQDMTIVDAKTCQVVGEAKLSRDPDPVSHSNMVFAGNGNLFLANADETVSVFTPRS